MATIIPAEIKSEIISLYEQGFSNSEIVKKCGQDWHRVRTILDRHKLLNGVRESKKEEPKREDILSLKAQGCSVKDISQKTGASRWAIWYHTSPLSKKQRSEKKETKNVITKEKPALIRRFERHEYHDIIMELHNGGMSQRDIYYSTGIDRATINHHLKGGFGRKRVVIVTPKYKQHGRQNEITTQEELIAKGFEFKKIRNLTIFENGEVFFNGEQLPHLLRKYGGRNSQCLNVNIPIKKDKYKQISLRRLVAMAFIPNPNEFPCVLNIDLNFRNCHVDNLKWGFPRTKDRRTENVHKIQPFLDTFDYENAEHMIRAVYDFLKTGNEAPLRQVFLEEKKYFRTVIANELYGKHLFRKFPLAEEIFEWCVDEIISVISRGFYIPKYLYNASFIIWCREGMKIRTKGYLSKKSKESSYGESILYETMQESY